MYERRKALYVRRQHLYTEECPLQKLAHLGLALGRSLAEQFGFLNRSVTCENELVESCKSDPLYRHVLALTKFFL